MQSRVKHFDPKGIILSGGPDSATESDLDSEGDWEEEMSEPTNQGLSRLNSNTSLDSLGSKARGVFSAHSVKDKAYLKEAEVLRRSDIFSY